MCGGSKLQSLNSAISQQMLDDPRINLPRVTIIIVLDASARVEDAGDKFGSHALLREILQCLVSSHHSKLLRARERETKNPSCLRSSVHGIYCRRNVPQRL